MQPFYSGYKPAFSEILLLQCQHQALRMILNIKPHVERYLFTSWCAATIYIIKCLVLFVCFKETFTFLPFLFWGWRLKLRFRYGKSVIRVYNLHLALHALHIVAIHPVLPSKNVDNYITERFSFIFLLQSTRNNTNSQWNLNMESDSKCIKVSVYIIRIVTENKCLYSTIISLIFRKAV